MIARNNVVEFRTDLPGYPWQIAAGDGETWIILRHKARLPVTQIAQLKNITMKDFNWRIFTKALSKTLFQGTVSLTVQYSEAQHHGEELPRETWVDEHLARESFIKDETVTGKNIVRKDSRVKTAFSSILLDKNMLNTGNESPSEGEGIWHLELPWQAWLYGTGKHQNPQVEKVHIAQVGLNTLLLEILIHLTANNELDLLNTQLLEYGLLPREELIFKIEGQEIEQILGVTVQRVFHQPVYDLESKKLQLRNFKEVDIIFISAEKGGERILTASRLMEEMQVIPFWPRDWKRPVDFGLFNKWLGLVKVAADQILFQGDYLWFVRSIEEMGTEKITALEEKRKNTLVAALPPPRKKPGEKWLKKDKKEQPQSSISKKAITVRF
jgi:hypothetical protein